MARIFDDFLVAVFLAMANTCCVTVAMAAPLASDQLPLDWPSASRQDAGNAKAQELVDGSHAAYLAGEFAAAVVLNTELLQLKPADPRIYYNRGNAYYKMRDLERALADFNAALKIAPKLYFALMSRGNVYSQIKRYDDAIADFNKALQLKPGDFLILYNRAIAKGRSGDKSGAIIDLREAIKKRPDDHQSYAALGDIFASQGDEPTARANYRRALELYPGNLHAAQKIREFDSATAKTPKANTTEPATIQRRVTKGAEQIAALAVDACFKNGADEAALRSMANSAKWSFVGDSELKKHSNMAASMVGGWTFVGETGAFAVMQSRENVTPTIHICSVTTKLGELALFGEVKSAFEMTAGVAVNDVNTSAGSETFGYWLRHTPECESRISLVHTVHSGIITVRILHGRVRGATAGDKSYPNMDSQ